MAKGRFSETDTLRMMRHVEDKSSKKPEQSLQEEWKTLHGKGWMSILQVLRLLSGWLHPYNTPSWAVSDENQRTVRLCIRKTTYSRVAVSRIIPFTVRMISSFDGTIIASSSLENGMGHSFPPSNAGAAFRGIPLQATSEMTVGP